MNTDELRKLAEAATPGPWMVDYQSSYPTGEMVVTENSGEIAFAQKRTAAYIAAVSPEVVLALLDRIEKLEKGFADLANMTTYRITGEDLIPAQLRELDLADCATGGNNPLGEK